MRLYVIRHGQTMWNKEKRMQGRKDIALNEEGLRLANETGIGMRDIPIDLVISSPLIRAKDTALAVMKNRNVPIIYDERIQEISFGDWEGKSFLTCDEISDEYRYQFYHEPLRAMVPPNGESFQEVVDRTGAFLKELMQREDLQDKTILISSHGAASRCLLSHFFEDKEDLWRGGVPKNCSVTIVDIHKGKGTVVELDHCYYEDSKL